MNNSLPLERENFGSLRKPYFLLEGDELTLHNYPVGSEPDPLTATEPPREPEPRPDPPLDFAQPAFAHSALYRYLVPRLRVAAPALALSLAAWGVIEPGSETSNAEQGANYIPTAYGVYRQPQGEVWAEGWDTTAALVQQLKVEVEAEGGELAVALLPAQEQVQPGAWQLILATYPAMQTQVWDLDQPNKQLAQILAAAGIPFLDLLPDFRAWDGDPLFYAIDGHWNGQGHALAGEKLRAWLLSEYPDVRLGEK